MNDIVNLLFRLFFLSKFLHYSFDVYSWIKVDSLHVSSRACQIIATRHSVNYREVDADYSTRLIGDSNDDSEIFMAIYRRPSAFFNARLSLSQNNNDANRDIENYPR